MNVRYYRCLYYFLFLYHITPPPLPFSIDQVRRPNMKYLPRPEWFFFSFLYKRFIIVAYVMFCYRPLENILQQFIPGILLPLPYHLIFTRFPFMRRSLSRFFHCGMAWWQSYLCLDIEFDCRLFCEQLVWRSRFLFARGL